MACFGGIGGNASDCLADKGFSFLHEIGDGVNYMHNFHAEAGGAEDSAAREQGYEQLINFAGALSECSPCRRRRHQPSRQRPCR